MLIKTLLKKISKEYPLNLAEKWDNVGLIIGDEEKEVKKVQISLDCTEGAIDKAIEEEVNLIITHHPLIFGGISNITNKDPLGRKVMKLIENGIAVYSTHTNLDSAHGGLNDYIVKKLGIEKSKVLDIKKDKDGNNIGGIGRIYSLPEETNLLEYGKEVKEKLSLDEIKVVGNLDRKVKKVAIVNGSGASYLNKVKKQGVDLFITGDVKYHDGLDAKELGIGLFDIGHYESECFFNNILINLCEELPVIVYNSENVFKKI